MSNILKRTKQRVHAARPDHQFGFSIDPSTNWVELTDRIWSAGLHNGTVGTGITGEVWLSTDLSDPMFDRVSKMDRRDLGVLRSTVISAIQKVLPAAEPIGHWVSGTEVWARYPADPVSPEVTQALRQHFRADEIEKHGTIVDSFV